MAETLNESIDLKTIQEFEGKYPKQLWYLFMTEMWERFCFYGMRGMLVVFMVSQLSIADTAANLQYGAIQAFIYAFTFIGGLFADKILGFQKSLFWGGLLMITGSFIIAASPASMFYIGTCFTIVGTGFFKPNISTMVGELYSAGDPRRDAGFGLFYSGINIGALLGGVICVYLGKYFSWSLAFGAAGVVMIIGLLTFALTRKTMGPIGASPLLHLPAGKRKTYEIAVFIGSLAVMPLVLLMVQKTEYTDYFMYTIGPVTFIYLIYEMIKLNAAERKKMIAAIVFIVFSVLFWAFFEQSGGSLSLFALNNLKHSLIGIEAGDSPVFITNLITDPNVINNSVNSFFVIIFSIIFGLMWIWMAKKKIEPNSVVKFGLGFLFLGGAFYVFYATRFFADATGMTSLNVFTLGYLVITFGELCLSPIGLSLMTKLSPKKLWGVMMGMWFLASAYGQYVAGLLGAGIAEAGENSSLMDKLLIYTDGYKQLGLYAVIAGVILLIISPIVRKLMVDVK